MVAYAKDGRLTSLWQRQGLLADRTVSVSSGASGSVCNSARRRARAIDRRLSADALASVRSFPNQHSKTERRQMGKKLAQSLWRRTPNHRKPSLRYFAIQYSISVWVSLKFALPSDTPVDRTNPFIAANLPVPPKIWPTPTVVRFPAGSAWPIVLEWL